MRFPAFCSCIFASLLVSSVLSSAAHAENVMDRKKQCQAEVPAGWTADKISKSMIKAKDGKATAMIGSAPANRTLDQEVAAMKAAPDTFKDVREVEKKADFVLLSYKDPNQGAASAVTEYYAIVVRGAGACTAAISCKNKADEKSCMSIAHSLKGSG